MRKIELLGVYMYAWWLEPLWELLRTESCAWAEYRLMPKLHPSRRRTLTL